MTETLYPTPSVQAIPAREKLPNRRASESFQFEHGGVRYTASVSFFDGQRLGEIFIDALKPGSAIAEHACGGARKPAPAAWSDCGGNQAQHFGTACNCAQGCFGAGAMNRNNIVPFPQRAPFAVRVEREQAAWLVVCRDHGWLHASYRAALAEATAIARGFGVVVQVAS